MIGRVLSNRYVVEDGIGSGGMGVVYRAWDTKQKQMVAIKVLRSELEQDKEFIRRFAREAEAAAKMSHENIVKVIDVGRDGGQRYIVMEYVDGQTLKEKIFRDGKLRPETAVRMVIRILAAVDHAHRNGIVHRDIKPQNILVDRNGTVKVSDFGIARLKNQQAAQIEEGSTAAMGSVHYFSPEQARGNVADEKSDLYSVGVVLYEMLTGKVPFEGDTQVSVALKHLEEEPKSMREIDPSISQALDEVVQRALSKDSERRYQTAAEMAADLRKALNRPEGGFVRYPLTQEEIVRRREEEKRREEQRRHRMRVIARVAGILGALALVLGLVWYYLFVYDVSEVPPVVGLSLEDAEWTLSDSGFIASTLSVYDEEVEAGTVLSQDPVSGVSRKRGTSIQITVSAGSQWVYLDDLEGLTLNAALEMLDGIGADRVTQEFVMSDAEASTIVGQEPEAGWITRETPIILRVSGERTIAPSLVNLTSEGAAALIEAEGLRVGEVLEAYSPDAEAGTVIAQSVAPGAPVLVGSSIDLTISQAQPERDVWAVEYTIVVPLDEIHVRVELVTPSGEIVESYNEVLNRGTYVITLESLETGEHGVDVYFDDLLFEETKINFG